ncbi:MAG: hypothetical protein HYW52_07940 [Gemmatimonadetes bacterium]|nr:hypothetical protein [Gemmatimonadota bacterium]MBI2615587.1 hypothetical protein [Gemmatimonadota bacterium]
MRRTATLTLGTLIALVCFAPSALAQRGQKPKGNQPAATAAVSVTFSDAERKIIVDYYEKNRYQAKPLPPGIARNLARGKPLPPGIAKQRLPSGLVALLPPRSGFEITIFGDRVVLLQANVVVDVLVDVF